MNENTELLTFEFDGIDSSKYNMFILSDGDDITLPSAPSFSDQVASPFYQNISYYLGTSLQQKTFTFNCVVVDTSISKIKEMLEWLNVEKQAKFTINLGINRNFFSTVKVSSLSEFSMLSFYEEDILNIRNNKYNVKVSISFTTIGDFAMLPKESPTYTLDTVPLSNNLDPWYGLDMVQLIPNTELKTGKIIEVINYSNLPIFANFTINGASVLQIGINKTHKNPLTYDYANDLFYDYDFAILESVQYREITGWKPPTLNVDTQYGFILDTNKNKLIEDSINNAIDMIESDPNIPEEEKENIYVKNINHGVMPIPTSIIYSENLDYLLGNDIGMGYSLNITLSDTSIIEKLADTNNQSSILVRDSAIILNTREYNIFDNFLYVKITEAEYLSLIEHGFTGTCEVIIAAKFYIYIKAALNSNEETEVTITLSELSEQSKPLLGFDETSIPQNITLPPETIITELENTDHEYIYYNQTDDKWYAKRKYYKFSTTIINNIVEYDINLSESTIIPEYPGAITPIPLPANDILTKGRQFIETQETFNQGVAGGLIGPNITLRNTIMFKLNTSSLVGNRPQVGIDQSKYLWSNSFGIVSAKDDTEGMFVSGGDIYLLINKTRFGNISLTDNQAVLDKFKLIMTEQKVFFFYKKDIYTEELLSIASQNTLSSIDSTEVLYSQTTASGVPTLNLNSKRSFAVIPYDTFICRQKVSTAKMSLKIRTQF